jgi:hypothetical protein
MRDMLAVIVRHIVDDPTAVSVAEIKGDDAIRYEVRVAPNDVGRVIGKQGKVIRALRVVVRSVAAQDQRRVDVELAKE